MPLIDVGGGDIIQRKVVILCCLGSRTTFMKSNFADLSGHLLDSRKPEGVIPFAFPFAVDNQWSAWMAFGVRPCSWGAMIEDSGEEGPYVDVYLQATSTGEFARDGLKEELDINQRLVR